MAIHPRCSLGPELGVWCADGNVEGVWKIVEKASHLCPRCGNVWSCGRERFIPCQSALAGRLITYLYRRQRLLVANPVQEAVMRCAPCPRFPDDLLLWHAFANEEAARFGRGLYESCVAEQLQSLFQGSKGGQCRVLCKAKGDHGCDGERYREHHRERVPLMQRHGGRVWRTRSSRGRGGCGGRGRRRRRRRRRWGWWRRRYHARSTDAAGNDGAIINLASATSTRQSSACP